MILGAGFAGLECAKALADASVDVTVVDRHNFHTFSPLLYQVATSALAPADVSFPVRGILRRSTNVAFRHATVTGVDWGTSHLVLDGEPPLRWDRLVLAGGATTNWLGVEGAAEHAFALYALGDAVGVRNHVLERFEAADADPTLLEAGALTVVLVGGGPTGVEMSGALSELFEAVLAKDFPRLETSRTRVVLVEMADRLLASFSEKSSAAALEQLEARGVEVRLGETVAEVTASSVRLSSGEVLPTQTVVWAAGVRANPLADTLGLDQGRGGRIKVGPALTVAGHPGVYVIGDLAAIADGHGGLHPQLAPVARQSGRFVGEAIAGAPASSFVYRDKGTMATIGRRAAVADMPYGLHLRGTLGWLAWLGLHLLYLAGFRNRLSVFVNWAWNYVTFDRGPRLILHEEQRAAPG